MSSFSRRAFLGSAAMSCVGLPGAARAGWRDDYLQKQKDKVDGQVAHYAGPVDGNGYLDQAEFAIDHCLRGPQTPYQPQPGDLFFSITNTPVYRAGHWLVGAKEPSHCGTIFRKPDGSYALLEAGSFDMNVIKISDLIPILTAYDNRERVWIRTRAVPLTEEQSAHMTCEAMAQDGKRFAVFRIYAQITPFRARGPIRTNFMGHPHGMDRGNYYCAELTTELAIAVGLIDPCIARPSATYPYELFYDSSHNPYLNKHFKLALCWNPPARWRSCLNKPDGNDRKKFFSTK